MTSHFAAIEALLEIREDPKLWFQGFGRFRDEQTRLAMRGRANVLQRRMFEHYVLAPKNRTRFQLDF
jgi:hypothetical protein